MILFLTNAYPDYQGAFRGHFVKKLAIDLYQSAVRVVVLTPRVFKVSPVYQKEPEGLEVYRFRYPSGERQLLEFRMIPYFRMMIFMASGFWATLRLARRYRAKIIHAHWLVPTGFLGAMVGKLIGIPVIVHARGTDVHTYALKGPLMRRISAWTLKSATHIIVASSDMQEMMTRVFCIPAKSISTIPTGVDTASFTPASCQITQPLLKASSINLLFVGGLYPVKGIHVLLEAVKRLMEKRDSYFLKLVGKGPLEEEIRTFIKQHHLEHKIQLTGALPHDELKTHICQADIFILPSLNEGTPNSLLEAMACAVPVVASAVGEIPRIIHSEKEGVLVKPGSAQDIYDAIEALVTDASRYRTICANTRNSVMRYGKAQSLDKIIAIYHALTKEL